MSKQIKLNHIHYRVYNLFEDRNIAGEHNAVKLDVLAAYFDIPRRELQRIIEEINLSSHFHKPIIGTSKGVFMATSVKEGLEKIQLLKRKSVKALKRVYAVEDKLRRNGQKALVLPDKPYSKDIITSVLEVD